VVNFPPKIQPVRQDPHSKTAKAYVQIGSGLFITSKNSQVFTPSAKIRKRFISSIGAFLLRSFQYLLPNFPGEAWKKVRND
jgi:hypothetical protein